VGSPFAGCSISGSTVTCNQDVNISSNASSIAVCTTASPLTINMGFNTLDWGGQNGILGTAGNTINVIATQINVDGNNFTSYGNWTAVAINCQTNSSTSISGTLIAASNSCRAYNNKPVVSVPTVTTNSSSAISGTGATLNGTVSSNGASTTVTFNYGTTTSYGTSVTATQSPLATSASASAVSYSLTGLSCGTTYHFRVSATNSAGTSNGSDATFTTTACVGVFDAYETSFTSADAIAGTAKIKTHVASNAGICVNLGSCTLKVGSFNVGKTALNTSFTGPVLVEIVNSSIGTCTTFASIATVSSSLTLSASGETVVTLPAVPNAYSNARLRISYPANGPATVQSCSSDNFAIRPSSFNNVTVKDGTPSTAGTTNSLTNTVFAMPSPVHKAGRPFSLNATAVNASGTTTSNYSGTASAVLTACSGTACINPPGTLTLGGSFISGVLASTSAIYSDLGAFTLNLQDSTFASVDAGDSSPAERYINSAIVLDVGRFIPDHFDTVVATQGCTTFTYSGQPFTSVMVYARDATGNNLANYASGLLANAVTLTDANGAASFNPSSISIAATAFTSLGSNSTPTFTFSSRNTGPTTVKLRATDTDGVSSSTGSDGTSATAVEGTGTIVSGRLRLLNSYGSERLPLLLTTKLEYYDATIGVGWRASGGAYTDTCTKLAASNFAFTTTSPACTAPVASCNTALTISMTPSAGLYVSPWTVNLSKPNAAGSGCITMNLDGAAAGRQCTATGTPGATATSAVGSWLKYPWNSSAASNPTANYVFGVYKSPLIYRRESY